MTLTNLVPTLYTRDVPGSVDFYCKVLGFEAGDADDGGSWAFVYGPRGPGPGGDHVVTLMFTVPNEHRRPFTTPAFTGSLYLHTDDVDAVWARVKDVARICYPIETFGHGMREFALYDNNGYLIQFGQEVAA